MTALHRPLALLVLAAIVRFPAASGAGTLVTPERTLDSEKYPEPPRITVEGAVFTVEHAGKATRFVRPLVGTAEVAPAEDGRIIHIAPSGQGDGTEEAPFGSINAAIEAADPGDAVVLHQGEYAECVVIRKSGTPERPLVITAAPGALPRIVLPWGAPSRTNIDERVHPAVVTLTGGAKHVWIHGLVAEGALGRADSPKQEMYGANGFQIAGRAGDGVRLVNCITYWDLHCGFKEMGHGGTGFAVENCVAFWCGTRGNDHGAYIPSSDAAVRGCLFFETAGYGIHAYSKPERLLIERNLCVRNKACGIIVSGARNRVLHNTCVGNGRGMFFFRGGCIANTVMGNIFALNDADIDVDNGGGAYGDPDRNTCDYNLTFGGKSRFGNPDKAAQFSGEHDVHLDPRFADPANGDYRLEPGSPASGSGPATPDGNPTDIGAFGTGARQ